MPSTKIKLELIVARSARKGRRPKKRPRSSIIRMTEALRIIILKSIPIQIKMILSHLSLDRSKFRTRRKR